MTANTETRNQQGMKYFRTFILNFETIKLEIDGQTFRDVTTGFCPICGGQLENEHWKIGTYCGKCHKTFYADEYSSERN